MSRIRDAWYIRLPGGQEIKAKSTAAVIHHLENGTIPKTSLARRSRGDEWLQLEWHSEFTEAVTGKPRAKETVEARTEPPEKPPSAVATRLDPMRLRTVGIRGLLDDLGAALDSTFTRDKLFVAGVAAALIGLIWGGVPWLLGQILSTANLKFDDDDLRWIGRFIRVTTMFTSLIVLAGANGLLARMTHLELAHQRGIGWRTAMTGFGGQGIRLSLAYVIILGGSFVAMAFLRWLPRVIFAQLVSWGVPVGVAEFVPGLLSILGVIIEVKLWLLAALTWLLAPVMIGENYLIGPGIREWISMLRAHFSRILLAEMLTLALGILIAAPIYLPVEYALTHYVFLPLPVRTVAMALALTGFLAFMAVANVLIYLDVKYEHGEQ